MHAARSMAEAFLYLELDPCECAEVEADWDVASVSTLDEGGMSIKFDGTCRGCGRVRTSYFTVPDQATQLPPDRFAGPDDGPSTLFDPAEWWAIGTQYGEAADRRLADVVTEPDPGEQRAREQPAGEQAAGEHPAGGLRPGEQPGWHDHQAWSELTGLLARSAAAVDEMLRFLPDDATELPRDAFYTPWGRELRDREPERFARGTLATEATVRRQKLDSFVAAHPEPLQETDEVAVELARLPLARSNDEAQLYLALHSCECGETEFPPNVEQSEEADGILVLRYTGRCISCGQARAFAFRQRDDPSVQTGGGWAGTEPAHRRRGMALAGRYLARRVSGRHQRARRVRS